MALAIGSRVGPYEITAAVGAGGMGEVWRGRDERLERDVAIKVLPSSFTADPERLARFEREAKLLASLNHPHIAQIYGLELAADGARALVMELVPGPDLAERLSHGALPPDEAISLARQLIDALEEAHEKGIVHRDLKPQNIKVAVDGKAKVLDFGLAKAIDPASLSTATAVANSPTLMNSPTLVGAATELGVILGTAAYMSPEQARGRAVDKRADIWAFGCVLWEMLTGEKLFAGETSSDTLAAVLRQEIPWQRLPANLASGPRLLLRRCLERDPRQRLRDIGDARHLLDASATEIASPATGNSPPSTAGRLRRIVPWILSFGLGLALILLALRSRGGIVPPPPAVAVLTAPLPGGARLDIEVNASQTGVLAIAPDGSRFAFTAETDQGELLYVRELRSLEATAITGTRGATSPFFSPDGKWIGFFADSKLRKVAVAGGEPIAVADSGLDRGGLWTPDGSIVYAPGPATPLMRIPAVGGVPQALTTLDAENRERSHRWPTLLPGGREIAFTVGTLDKAGSYNDAEIAAVDLATGKRRSLVRGASMARGASNGQLLLARGGEVFAIDLAGAKGAIPSEITAVLRNVGGDPASGIAYFDIAANGTLIYAERDPNATLFQLAWIDPRGKVEILALPPREFRVPRLSPDGRRIVVGIGRGGGGESDLWLHELGSGGLDRLTFDGRSSSPVWTLDGRAVVYNTAIDGKNVFARKAIDGRTEPEIVLAFQESRSRGPLSFSPEGALLYSDDLGAGSANDLFVLPAGATEPRVFAQTAAVEIGGTFSPDGRFVAYSINSSGEADIFVQAFPGPGGRWQVAQGVTGGLAWSRDGREFLFSDGKRMMAASVRPGDAFSTEAPRILFDVPFLNTEDVFTNFDVARDGRVLVVRRLSEKSFADHLVVAVNWQPSLEQPAPRH